MRTLLGVRVTDVGYLVQFNINRRVEQSAEGTKGIGVALAHKARADHANPKCVFSL
jgi:hypothetical protein